MPNGRSGGFVICKDDLRQLVTAISGAVTVGKRFGSGSLLPMSATEAAQLVEELAHDRVSVEEQDKKYYIIHISDSSDTWIKVQSDSPIFEGLRRWHTRWVAERQSSK